MEQRDAITIRFPAELVSAAKAVKEDEESFNDLVVSSLEEKVRRRRAWAAHRDILRIREQILARTGPQEDPVALIRSLREGEGRRD